MLPIYTEGTMPVALIDQLLERCRVDLSTPWSKRAAKD